MRSIFLIQEEWRHEKMSKEFDKQSSTWSIVIDKWSEQEFVVYRICCVGYDRCCVRREIEIYAKADRGPRYLLFYSCYI